MAISPRYMESAPKHIEFELTRGWGVGDLDLDEIVSEVPTFICPPVYDWLLINGKPTNPHAPVHGFLVHQLPIGVALRESADFKAFFEEEDPLGERLESDYRYLADPVTGEFITELFRYNPEYPLYSLRDRH